MHIGRKGKTDVSQRPHTLLTCGFDLARFSILIQASSRSFDFAFSLLNEAPDLHSLVCYTDECENQHNYSAAVLWPIETMCHWDVVC